MKLSETRLLHSVNNSILAQRGKSEGLFGSLSLSIRRISLIQTIRRKDQQALRQAYYFLKLETPNMAKLKAIKKAIKNAKSKISKHEKNLKKLKKALKKAK